MLLALLSVPLGTQREMKYVYMSYLCFDVKIDHIPIHVLKFNSWVKKNFFSISKFSIPNLIVIHLIECDSGPPANHDPLPDNIQGNCLLTPPTFHPINADNGFVEQFHKVFPPPVRSVVFCCLILALLLVKTC